MFVDAIEDSTQDLWIWLHRHGKNMVGEWVILWINEMRDEWKAERVRNVNNLLTHNKTPLSN